MINVLIKLKLQNGDKTLKYIVNCSDMMKFEIWTNNEAFLTNACNFTL